MLTCDICGKKIFTAYPQNWPYKHMSKVFCSEDCRIVYKARDLHKFEYVRLEAPELQGYTVDDLKAVREKHSVTRESLLGCQLIFLQKLCRPEGNGKIYSKF